MQNESRNNFSRDAEDANLPAVVQQGNLNDQEAIEPGVDAMGSSSTYLIYPERPEQSGANFFGPSSTVSFLSLVRHIVSGSGSPLATATSGKDEALPKSSEDRSKQVESHLLQDMASKYGTTAFHIPPRREADTLIANYWTWVHTIYPVLHRPSFNNRYQKLWQWQSPSSGRTNLDDVLFHCRLNAVFALGAHFQSDVEPADRKKISESFFLRAQHLLTMDLLAYANLEMVQSLVLMAQYLQSTDKPNYCWSIAGLAIRLAQAIGLHLESSQSEAAGHRLDQVDIEVKRRAWTNCILLDR